MKGQVDFEGIIGVIILLIGLTMFLTIFLPVSTHLASLMQQAGCEKYINEINNLKSEIQELRAQLDERDSEIIRLNSLLSSLNKSLGEKDELIVNLTTELNKTRKENEILKKEINYYEEKKYITEIHNYFLNISNQLTKIQNRFFILEFYVGLLSLSLLTLIIEITLKPGRKFSTWIRNRIKQKISNKIKNNMD